MPRLAALLENRDGEFPGGGGVSSLADRPAPGPWRSARPHELDLRQAVGGLVEVELGRRWPGVSVGLWPWEARPPHAGPRRRGKQIITGS